MHIANIIEEGRWGGPQKRITMVASALKNHAIDTTVLLPTLDSERFRRALDSANINWKALSIHRLGRGSRTLFVYILTFIFDTYLIWYELHKGGYDLIHVSGGVSQFKGVIAGRLAGIPVVWHLNDTQMPRSLVLLFNILSSFANAFIVTANRVRDYYLNNHKFNNIDIFTVQAPVDVHKYCRDRVRTNKLINTVKGIKIVTVTNINPVKGLETLITSISLLKKDINELHLYIAGSVHRSQKSYYTKLNGIIKELGVKSNITFLGQQDDIPSILAACDIFVCSSIAESGPMSVWEAMSMGCAIVSTNVGDVDQYIKNGENGFIVSVGDANDMAVAILKLAKDEELRQVFGEKARDVACRELDISIITEKTARVYFTVFSRYQ